MQFDFTNISLIVGLGNPQSKFTNTRHNAGFKFVDNLSNSFQNAPSWQFKSKLSSQLSFINLDRDSDSPSHRCILAKPQTGMNVSGRAVAALLDYYQIDADRLLLCYDDLDIELGSYKLKFASYPKAHNGVNSVIKSVSTDQFWDLKLGIDTRNTKERNMPGAKYALSNFKQKEQQLLTETFLKIKQQYFTF